MPRYLWMFVPRIPRLGFDASGHRCVIETVGSYRTVDERACWLRSSVLARRGSAIAGDGEEGLDRATLVNSGVGGDVVEVGGVVEHEAGVDASGGDVVE